MKIGPAITIIFALIIATVVYFWDELSVILDINKITDYYCIEHPIKKKDYYRLAKNYIEGCNYTKHEIVRILLPLKFEMQPFINAIVKMIEINGKKYQCECESTEDFYIYNTVEDYCRYKSNTGDDISFYEYYWKMYCLCKDSYHKSILRNFHYASIKAPELIDKLRPVLISFLNSLSPSEQKKIRDENYAFTLLTDAICAYQIYSDSVSWLKEQQSPT